MGVDGRWTVWVNPHGARVLDDDTQVADEVPVVPCDDAAVERAAEALYELSRGQAWPGVLGGIAISHVGVQTVAEAVLRAAGGQDAS